MIENAYRQAKVGCSSLSFQRSLEYLFEQS